MGCSGPSGPDFFCDATASWQKHPASPVFGYNPNLIDGIPGDPSILAVESGYVMYYGAVRGDFSDPATVRIFRATSTDGVTWQRNSVPVLEPGVGWDDVKVETPSALRRPDGTLAMYYSGNGEDSEVGFQIGLATSTDGIAWQRHGSSPVLASSADEISLIGPSVIYDAGNKRYVMLYAAINGTTYRIDIRLATSDDGFSWTRRGVVLEMDSVERLSPDDFGVMGPELLATDSGFEMVYNSLVAPNAASAGIFYARSTDARTWTKHPKLIYKPTGGDAFDATETGAQAWVRSASGYRLWYVGTHTDYTSRFDSGFGLLERPCE
jgi:predicted GH43/DUF377 family glycosyl hydrolase